MNSFGKKRYIGGLALAVAGVTALAACSSSSSSTAPSTTPGVTKVPGGLGSIPASGTPSGKTATITWAQAPGTFPNWILPIPTSAVNSVFNVFTFEWMMWRPVYWTVNGVTAEVTPSMSLANPPVWSNNDKTVSVTFKGWKWNDGQPITANDLLFDIDLIKAGIKEAPSNWSGYVPGHFPDNLVSTSEPSASTLVMNFSSTVNPSWFTNNFLGQGPLVPLPAQTWAKESATGPIVTNWSTDPAVATKIFNFLTAQAKDVSTYATNPLWQTVDGPYKLSAYNATTGAYTLVPNTSYGGPHANPVPTFEAVPFTSDTAEFNAIKAGSIDVGYVPQTDVPQLPQLSRLGYAYFGMPDFGMNFANYNFKDTTGSFDNIVAQLYFRQAMAHVEDQQGWISAFMYGAGDPAYGPIPAYPQSPYLPSNAATNPYPFNVNTAISILKSNGWTVNPGGIDSCAKAGSGAGDCGAGIPAGTKLSFNLIYSTTPALIGEQMTDLVSQAKKAGIDITLSSSNFDYMITNYIDPAAPANENKWAMMDFGGETADPYPTTFGLFNTGGSSQIGDYSNPTADALINDSISGGNPTAVKNEAAFLTNDQPVMFQPNPDYIWAWKTNISATDSAAFENLTQYYATPEFWYTTK
jgi:peptide/nickel transport system substrate-binding protein